jgi:enoyl-CoA hydratase
MSLWTTERDGAVVVATYLNPPMNYFCAEGAGELLELIETWRDPEIRAVVLTGGMDGKFITHYSVEELVDIASDKAGMEAMGTALNANYHAMLRKLRDLPKVVIAAMNGDTMGGGFELSLSCDIRIGGAGDHRFGLPEITLGILPGGCGTQRLPRMIGVGRAIDFILRGRICRPEEALEMGLIAEVAPDAAKRAREVARGLATQNPSSVAEIKRCLYQGIETHLEGGLEIEGHAFMETMKSPRGLSDMQEYIALPFEKRRDWLERKSELIHPRKG